MSNPLNDFRDILLICRRYLLERPSQPLLERCSAHYQIALACVLSMILHISLIDNSTAPEARRIAVGKGFHGLLPYADEYWLEHLLQHLDLKPDKIKLSNSDILSSCLMTLYNKHETCSKSDSQKVALGSLRLEKLVDKRVEHLREEPKILSFIQQIAMFRRSSNSIQAKDGTGKSFSTPSVHIEDIMCLYS